MVSVSGSTRGAASRTWAANGWPAKASASTSQASSGRMPARPDARQTGGRDVDPQLQLVGGRLLEPAGGGRLPGERQVLGRGGPDAGELDPVRGELHPGDDPVRQRDRLALGAADQVHVADRALGRPVGHHARAHGAPVLRVGGDGRFEGRTRPGQPVPVGPQPRPVGDDEYDPGDEEGEAEPDEQEFAGETDGAEGV